MKVQGRCFRGDNIFTVARCLESYFMAERALFKESPFTPETFGLYLKELRSSPGTGFLALLKRRVKVPFVRNVSVKKDL